MFLADPDSSGKIQESRSVEYVLLENDDEEKIAGELLELKPDVAAALSFYVTPFDWLTVKDAMVADYLRAAGIKTFCHSVECAVSCMDKWRTHQLLVQHGIKCPAAVYLHHELFMNAGNRREIKSNVYRSSVLHQIKRMKYPLIIKDTTGLSSYGADVVSSYGEALAVLNSRKTTGDRIIEELISGVQSGAELYGCEGNYTVMPPFVFSVNRYGITSPKQSVKAGPPGKKGSRELHCDELNELLLTLAEKLKLCGCVQVDLVFDGKQWNVIEINPRLSGMTSTYAASCGTGIGEFIYGNLIETSGGEKSSSVINCAVNLKFKIMPLEKLQLLKIQKGVAFVNQVQNHAARQIREQGYCEVVVTGSSRNELEENLRALHSAFSEEGEEAFFMAAENLFRYLD